eukprot:scaffold34686_cov63-Phaeocystis_antarctica.AAC.4
MYGDYDQGQLHAAWALCARTGSLYHCARGDTSTKRPKEVVLEDRSSDERKGGLQFLLDDPADSPPEESETLRASGCVAWSQPPH